jgi:hypothetical protein
MTQRSLEMVTLADRPDLEDQIDRLSHRVWPRFFNHGGVSTSPFWPSLFKTFIDSQIIFLEDGATVAGVGHTVPIAMEDPSDLPTGVDTALQRGVENHERGIPPTTICAVAAMVPETHRGRGLGSRIVRAMTDLAAAKALDAVIAPVRPTRKSLYPLTPFDRYVRWTLPGGAPFDPWIRVHWRLGARILGITECAITVKGTVEQWEEWTGLAFPESGDYAAPGALAPVAIDRERNTGVYREPNLWMRHAATPSR